jgi:hypothetical protein
VRYFVTSALCALCIALAGCTSDNVTAVRVDDVNGVPNACGEGFYLTPCASFQGETSNKELDQEAAQIRNETPKQQQETIELLESTPAGAVDPDNGGPEAADR